MVERTWQRGLSVASRSMAEYVTDTVQMVTNQAAEIVTEPSVRLAPPNDLFLPPRFHPPPTITAS